MVHKSNGARAGYLIFSGAVVMLVCMTGLVPTVLHWVPLAVVAMVIVWFGLVMVGQPFQEVSKEHGVAVVLGLVPMLAAWALQWVICRCTKVDRICSRARRNLGMNWQSTA
jgi:adenine/guanine/hypoxanthine permease